MRQERKSRVNGHLPNRFYYAGFADSLIRGYQGYALDHGGCSDDSVPGILGKSRWQPNREGDNLGSHWFNRYAGGCFSQKSFYATRHRDPMVFSESGQFQ